MSKDNRAPLVRGSADGLFLGCVLVPVRYRHRTFPKVNTAAPTETYYRYNKARGRLVCMVTVTPTGLQVAWDTCAACSAYFKRCKCKAGVTAPTSIAHIYTQDGGVLPIRAKAEPSSQPFVLREINKPKSERVNGTPTPLVMRRKKRA